MLSKHVENFEQYFKNYFLKFNNWLQCILASLRGWLDSFKLLLIPQNAPKDLSKLSSNISKIKTYSKNEMLSDSVDDERVVKFFQH